MTDRVRIMGVYAHPADVATEAAGTMAIHADRGDDLVAVVLTDGIRMHPHYLHGSEREPITPDQYRELKREEARRAAEIIGFGSVAFLGWNDDFWNATDARVEELATLIARQQPDVVATHYPVGPYMIDSNAFAGVYVARAVDVASALVPDLDGVAGHFVKELVFFLMDQSIDTRSKIGMTGIVADFYVDISAVVGRKVRAIDQYDSQGYGGQFARKVTEARDGRVGMLANTSYAEAFMYARGTTFASLPLPPSVLDRRYIANDLPGDQISAWQTPSGRPPEA